MKYFEIKAVKGEQQITERYMQDGVRFIRSIPFNPAMFIQIKEQFKGKNVSVELGANRWIRIARTGEVAELKSAGEKATGLKEITREDVVKIEADMLKKAGFVVSIEEKGEDEDGAKQISN